MKQLGVLLLPLDGILVHCKGNLLTAFHPIYFPESSLPLSSGGMGNKDLWGKRSAKTGFLDFRFYCACVRLWSQDPWTSGLIAQVRWITLSQRSLLPIPLLDKGNEYSGNEIAFHQVTITVCGIHFYTWLEKGTVREHNTRTPAHL